MGNGTRVTSLGGGAASAIGARVVFASRTFTQVVLVLRVITGGSGVVRIGRKGVPLTMCLRAIDLDDAGTSEIYKLNILEGMNMAKAAWGAVSSETIAHCWKHTDIQPKL